MFKETEEIQPAQAGFVCVDAVSTARSSTVLKFHINREFLQEFESSQSLMIGVLLDMLPGDNPIILSLRKNFC